MTQKEPPKAVGACFQGFFFFYGEVFGPGYLLFVFVRPLAYAVSHYTCQYGEKKRTQYIYMTHPLSVTRLGW